MHIPHQNVSTRVPTPDIASSRKMLTFALLLSLASFSALAQTDLIDGHYKYKVN